MLTKGDICYRAIKYVTLETFLLAGIVFDKFKLKHTQRTVVSARHGQSVGAGSTAPGK